jgi:hypothetical protein
MNRRFLAFRLAVWSALRWYIVPIRRPILALIHSYPSRSACSPHGTQAQVDSQPAQGSRFCLIFARSPKEIVQGAAQAIHGEYGKASEPGGVTRGSELLASKPITAAYPADKDDTTGARQWRASL